MVKKVTCSTLSKFTTLICGMLEPGIVDSTHSSTAHPMSVDHQRPGRCRSRKRKSGSFNMVGYFVQNEQF